MALINDTSDNAHFIRNYKIPQTMSRKGALEWIASITNDTAVMVKRIELRDFVSFDDGTVSDSINKIDNTSHFIESYENSTIECVTLVGSYDSSSFSLSVNLDDGVVRLCFRKKDSLILETLELLFCLI